jgi:hypothetical protein
VQCRNVWPAYEASSRQRGSLTVRFSDDAIAAWAAERRTTWSQCGFEQIGGRVAHQLEGVAPLDQGRALGEQPLQLNRADLRAVLLGLGKRCGGDGAGFELTIGAAADPAAKPLGW